MSRLLNMFKVPDLRNKVLFTLLMIALYRFGAFVPVPGIDLEAVEVLRDQAREGGVLTYLSLFSGGGLTNFAVFALGIMPYITSSIIMQVLTVVIPKLEEWQNQGAVGQRKITQWTRYLTIAISVLQATSITFVLHNGGGGFITSSADFDLVPNFTPARVLLIVLTMTAGSAMLMWMGELISQRGIGNGMSLLIFSSIVSSLPQQGAVVKAEGGNVILILVVLAAVLLTAAIVFVESGQRRIPVQFPKQVVGRKMTSSRNTYIPLKVNQAGVIPIIFASSVLYLPQISAFVLPSSGWGAKVQSFLDDRIVADDPLYILVFGLLIIGFAYFYTAISFDPVKQADNLRKQGGFIPGIRPGPQTERYLGKIVSRITLAGALFIAIVALLPPFILVKSLPGGGQALSGFGGTSILIAVGVSLETMKQIDSQLMMRNYEGFLK